MAISCASVAFADVYLSTLDPYEIEWYTLATTANSEEAVMAEINKYLTEKFNATLKMYKNSNNDHATKLQMMVTVATSSIWPSFRTSIRTTLPWRPLRP